MLQDNLKVTVYEYTLHTKKGKVYVVFASIKLHTRDKMNSKLCEIINNLWFVIIEIIIVTGYALSVYFNIVNSEYRNDGYIFRILISAIVLLFSFVAIKKMCDDSKELENRFIAFLYAIVIAVDTCVNESLIGFVFVGILFSFLINSNKIVGAMNSVFQIFLSFIVGAEAVSLVAVIGDVKLDSILFNNMGHVWIDFVFVLAVLFECLTNGKKITNKILEILVRIVVIVLEISLLILLIVGAYLRNSEYCVTADDIKDGTTVYIVDANTGEQALLCEQTFITADNLTNDESQCFTFKKSNKKGYWKIWTADDGVFDVANIMFEDGNGVGAWYEGESDGQLWKIEDLGENVVKIYAYNSEFVLSWGPYEEDDGTSSIRTKLAVDDHNINSKFFLKKATTVNKPLAGWIVNGNRCVVIIVYCVFMFIVFLGTVVVFIRLLFEKDKCE